MYRNPRHEEQQSFVRSELREHRWMTALELLDERVPGTDRRLRDLDSVARLGRGKPVTREAA